MNPGKIPNLKRKYYTEFYTEFYTEETAKTSEILILHLQKKKVFLTIEQRLTF